ncbi:MAG: DUF4954 family protein [Planctomycetes bacterium]|nr:DUF4954 family protein [Planctomycetota bacterium]
MKTRRLRSEEITRLEQNGCSAEAWNAIRVDPEFVIGDLIRNVEFSGNLTLGTFSGTLRSSLSIPERAGLYSCRLHNVSVQNNCRIAYATVANTDVGENSLITHVQALTRTGDQPFGNGVFVHVLAEDGVRSIPMWRGLSAQTAHLGCFFKHHSVGVMLERIALKEAESMRRERSQIGSGCRIERCGTVDNVWIGDGASVIGAANLNNCTIEGDPVPARIGQGVTAKNCIFKSSCRVDGGARLDRCFVGQGVVVENDASAVDSLFFANCHVGHSEVVSAFLGPYTVSHHRSTLVLACQSSFANFGSGSNSSNHLYKLGPRHGGVLRRGVRCGSDSYLLWPSDIGAFSTVVGHHPEHLDTAMFPFSLLINKNDTSLLIPGANLFSIGAFRDALKWRERDLRAGIQDVTDRVNCAVLSPYVMEAMERGLALLNRVQSAKGDPRHGGAVIPEGRIRAGLTTYRQALRFYIGECLLRRLVRDSHGEPPSTDDCLRLLESIAQTEQRPDDQGWHDWGGMLVSDYDTKIILEGLSLGDIETGQEMHVLLNAAHDRYGDREVLWAGRRWIREHREVSRDAVLDFAETWRRSVQFRHERLLKDLAKEYAHEMMIGFGLEEEKLEAFRRIRGEASDHFTVKLANDQRDRLLSLAEKIV